MKLVPKRDQILGRLLITKLASTIVAPDATRGVTKVLLVLAVGADAAEEGYKPGDLVIPRALGNMPLRGGSLYVYYCDRKEVLFTVEDASPGDFVDSNGTTEVKSLDPADPTNTGAALS